MKNNLKRKKWCTSQIVLCMVMILVCMVMLYPVIYVLSRSIMGSVERSLNPLRLIPRTFDWSGYKFIFSENSNILHGYTITILRTVIGTALNVLLTTCMAYSLSKKYYPGRKIVTAMMVFTMWFSGGMIPLFLLVKGLGLMNNFWVYILPTLVYPTYVILMRNFFMEIPISLEESAKLDGANDLRIFWTIYLPLSKASIATITLFQSIYHWNSWMDAMLYVNDKNLWPVQYMLQQLCANSSALSIANSSAIQSPPSTTTVKMATIVIATVPILCIYPFVQKYFVKGMMIGSVKE